MKSCCTINMKPGLSSSLAHAICSVSVLKLGHFHWWNISTNVQYSWIMQWTLHAISVHVVKCKVRERLPYHVEHHSIVMRKYELEPWIDHPFTSTFITKTYLYNFDPLKPHFYIDKLEFTGVCIIFLISAQKHRLWVLVRTASARRF